MSTTDSTVAVNVEVMRELFEAVVQTINQKPPAEQSFKQLLPFALSSKQAYRQFLFQTKNASLGVTVDNGADIIFKRNDPIFYPVHELGTKYLISLIKEQSFLQFPIPKWYINLLKDKPDILNGLVPMTLEIQYADLVDISDFEYLLGNVPIKGLELFENSIEIDELLCRYPNMDNVHLFVCQDWLLVPPVKKISLSLNEYSGSFQITPKTTHVTVEYKNRFDQSRFGHCRLYVLDAVFYFPFEHLDVSINSWENTDMDTFRFCFDSFLRNMFNPFIKDALANESEDLRINFTYNFELPGVSVLREEFIDEVIDILAKADFHHVESLNNEKGISEVQFEASPREKIVCVLSVKVKPVKVDNVI